MERRCVGGRTPVRVRQFYVTNIELQMHLSGTNPVFYWRSQLCVAYLIFTFSNKISDSSVLQFYHFIIALLHVAVVGQCLLWHRKILRSFQFFAFLFFYFQALLVFTGSAKWPPIKVDCTGNQPPWRPCQTIKHNLCWPPGLWIPMVKNILQSAIYLFQSWLSPRLDLWNYLRLD